ncbi:MAG: CehA/McbA family metallohydrolase [Chloroflexi bacterium]|nr:CehA/McbA family metallohydrolase [Chloroflexota bacterium]
MPSIAPFGLTGSWFKGNLHTHTTQSDGELDPEEAIAWYRAHGYDFVAITDHWVYTRGRRIGQDFITLSGAELHGEGYHLLALGLISLPDRSLADDPQATVRAVCARGGLAFFAHPYWTGQRPSDMALVQGLAGIEVYNAVCEEMQGLGYARVHWDELLGRGLRLFGLAVDDVHWRAEHNAQGKGFVMVKAERLEEGSILEGLAKGHFYASTGPRLEDLRVEWDEAGQMALHVHCSPCRQITFYAHGPTGRRFTAPAGEWLDHASLPLKEEQVFLRVECQDDLGRIAWSNPLYVRDVLHSPDAGR